MDVILCGFEIFPFLSHTPNLLLLPCHRLEMVSSHMFDYIYYHSLHNGEFFFFTLPLHLFMYGGRDFPTTFPSHYAHMRLSFASAPSFHAVHFVCVLLIAFYYLFLRFFQHCVHCVRQYVCDYVYIHRTVSQTGFMECE